MQQFTIIGGGNLGQAIAVGLTKHQFCNPAQVIITRRNTSVLSSMFDTGFNVTDDNAVAIQKADVVFLCVKPYQIQEILEKNSRHFKPGQIVISVITGISIALIQQHLPLQVLLYRAMPNTAIAIGESMTCIAAAQQNAATDEQVNFLFSQMGKVVFINENLMDAATVLGACGTAFAMRFTRANIQGGIEIGFDSKTAALIAAQTLKGAAELLLQLGNHPEEEIDKVTTPKGCTIAGLNEMEHQGFSSSLIKGIAVSYKKIQSP